MFCEGKRGHIRGVTWLGKRCYMGKLPEGKSVVPNDELNNIVMSFSDSTQKILEL